MADKEDKYKAWKDWNQKRKENSGYENSNWADEEEENRKKAQEALSGKKQLEKIKKFFTGD